MPHTCPWWFAYTFDNRLRRLIHDPPTILHDLVHAGDTVIDVGCGLGYFTLGLAELVGPHGRVIAVDLQSEMLKRARRRAGRRGLADRIEFHQCTQNALGLSTPADFILAFWMVHEVENRRQFLSQLRALLKPSGRLLIAEPKGHVSASFFAREIQRVREAGFDVSAGPRVRLSRSVLCRTSSTDTSVV